MKQVCLLLGFITLNVMFAFSQISEGGTPYTQLHAISNKNIEVFTLPLQNNTLLEDDANLRSKKGEGPWLFASPVTVDLSPYNAGTWTSLPNGDKLWRLKIYSKYALNLNLYADSFDLPKGAKLFIYSPERDYVLGAFTYKNVNAEGIQGFDVMPGSEVILEYYEPKEAAGKTKLHFKTVNHGFRDFFHYAESKMPSGSCNINVKCPLGATRTDIINSVVIIVVGGSGACTGAMITDVPRSGTPYFLTARHCGTTGVGSWVFRFNYQTPTCSGGTAPTSQTVSGSVLRASNAASDFTLLQLNSTPPSSYNAFYAGWNRTNTAATSTVGIHHPSGDVKKISKDNGPTVNGSWGGTPANSHWEVDWDSAITEPGSSGSPLFDQNQQIVGQLHGGASSCTSVDKTDQYGRFSTSWDYGTTTATRLKEWLDPGNTAVNTMTGYYPGTPPPAADSLDVAMTSIIEPLGGTCNDSTFVPSVSIRNNATNTVRALTIKYKVDGGSTVSFNWTGTLASAASTNVTLAGFSTTSGVHSFTVWCERPNGYADQDSMNDTLRSSFTVRSGMVVTLRVRTDSYGDETFFNFYQNTPRDTSLRIAASSLADNTTYTYDLCVNRDKCYTFNIYDSGNDGICCSFGNGFALITYGDDTLGRVTSFTRSSSISFCTYLPVADFTVSDTALCLGESFTLFPSTNYVLSREWTIDGPAGIEMDTNTGVLVRTPSVAGDYDVLFIGRNPWGEDSAFYNNLVNVAPLLTNVVRSSVATCSICPDAVAYSTTGGGVPPLTHSWSNGKTTDSITGLLPGVYYDTLTDAYGCQRIDSVNVSFQSGIQINNESEILIYPNPAQSVIKMVNVLNGVSLKVIGVDGRCVMDIRNWSGNELDIRKLSPSAYVLEITTIKGVLRSYFVKE